MFGNRRARPGAALATAAASSWGAAACAGAAVVSVPAACAVVAAVEVEAPASDDALGDVTPPLESSDVGVCWLVLVLVDGMAGVGRNPGVVVDPG